MSAVRNFSIAYNFRSFIENGENSIYQLIYFSFLILNNNQQENWFQQYYFFREKKSKENIFCLFSVDKNKNEKTTRKKSIKKHEILSEIDLIHFICTSVWKVKTEKENIVLVVQRFPTERLAQRRLAQP